MDGQPMKEGNIEYRPFQNGDEREVYAVVLKSWRHAYGGIYSPEFIENFINTHYAPEKLRSLLPKLKKGKMFFQVAVDNNRNKIVGFCNIGDRGEGMELFRIYLLPSYIGKGIGKRLLQLGEEFIKSKGINKYFCYVHKNNQLGINFYLKSGFKHISKRDKEKDDEWCMEKELSACFQNTSHNSVYEED